MERDRWITRWALAAVEWIEEVAVLRADGTQIVEASPCIWTRLHRGSSTGGEVHVFLHSSRDDAMIVAAEFAVDVLGHSDVATRLYEAGKYEDLLALYERTHVSSDAILRVVWGLPVGDVSGVKGARRAEEQPPYVDHHPDGDDDDDWRDDVIAGDEEEEEQ